MMANLLSICSFYLCGTYGRQEGCRQGFGAERGHLEDLSTNGRII